MLFRFLRGEIISHGPFLCSYSPYICMYYNKLKHEIMYLYASICYILNHTVHNIVKLFSMLILLTKGQWRVIVVEQGEFYCSLQQGKLNTMEKQGMS